MPGLAASDRRGRRARHSNERMQRMKKLIFLFLMGMGVLRASASVGRARPRADNCPKTISGTQAMAKRTKLTARAPTCCPAEVQATADTVHNIAVASADNSPT